LSRIQDATRWFKETFGEQISAAAAETLFSLDLFTAIALQETYYIWGRLYEQLPVEEVLKLCVGDTLDAPKRSAFPKTKAELVAAPNGDKMFQIAREALEMLGAHFPEFHKIAQKYPQKFCHGFGIFQYDIQFFKTNPDFFLKRRWYSFDACLAHGVHELQAALKRAYGSDKTGLTDEEQVFVAIAYNRGSVDFKRGFIQGYMDENGKYYGEYIWDYLMLSKSIQRDP
jgi:hypothetical protein